MRWFQAHQKTLLVVFTASLTLALVLGLMYWTMRRPVLAPIVIREGVSASAPEHSPSATPGPVQVYVSGAVVHPGVYKLPWDGRVEAAIAAAGGTLASADMVRVNLAMRVYDEQQVYVPVQGEEATAMPHRAATLAIVVPGRKVNLNAASATELESLPGIGPALAQRIIEYRQTNGPFASTEDVKRVKGIGDALFAQIADLVSAE